MRKIKVTLLCLVLLFMGMPDFYTLDLPFEGNETEWKNFCLQENLSEEDEQSCKEYMKFVSQQSLELEEEIHNINKELDAVQHSIEKQIELIAKYQKQIDEFNEKIDQLQVVIDERTAQIIVKEKEIKDMEAEIAALNKKIRERMVQLQKNMKFNNSFDFLMGAEDFEDLIVRINGLAIMEKYDDDLKHKLKGLLEDLNTANALFCSSNRALAVFKSSNSPFNLCFKSSSYFSIIASPFILTIRSSKSSAPIKKSNELLNFIFFCS